MLTPHKMLGEGALWSRPAITSIPVPVEIAMRQGATSGSADEGTLVSSGWRNGE